MLNANLTVVVAALAAGMLSGCVAPRSNDVALSKDPREQTEQALQAMRERRQADPQVPGWAFVNPQQVRATTDAP